MAFSAQQVFRDTGHDLIRKHTMDAFICVQCHRTIMRQDAIAQCDDPKLKSWLKERCPQDKDDVRGD